MPELAEVALFAHDLSEIATKRRLTGVSFPNQDDWGRVIVPRSIQRVFRALVGQRVQFSSAGKGLFLTSKDGRQKHLEFRLGMTGQFRLVPPTGRWRRHCFAILRFSNVTVYYFDHRRFGRVAKPRAAEEGAIGGFAPGVGFWQASAVQVPGGFLTKPRIVWLLDSGDRTGVGNYMANEALGRMNLSPFTPCRTIGEAKRVLRKCAVIATQSIRRGGNSFGTGYFRLEGTEGAYARYCQFYQGEGVPKHLFRGRPVFSEYRPPGRALS
jgi:formamidopyrimidine-DNA glycosylase